MGFTIPNEPTLGVPTISVGPPPTPQVDLFAHRALLLERHDLFVQIKRLKARQEEVDAALRQAVGDSIGTYRGQEVFTYQPTQRFASVQFIKDNPDLARHFMVPRMVEELDVDLLLRVRPELRDQYQVRTTKFSYDPDNFDE